MGWVWAAHVGWRRAAVALVVSLPHLVTHCPTLLFALTRAIVFNRLSGIKEEVYEEGTHLMVPWLERPIIYDVRRKAAAGRALGAGREARQLL